MKQALYAKNASKTQAPKADRSANNLLPTRQRFPHYNTY